MEGIAFRSRRTSKSKSRSRSKSKPPRHTGTRRALPPRNSMPPPPKNGSKSRLANGWKGSKIQPEAKVRLGLPLKQPAANSGKYDENYLISKILKTPAKDLDDFITRYIAGLKEEDRSKAWEIFAIYS